jgi:hypothetical protein
LAPIPLYVYELPMGWVNGGHSKKEPNTKLHWKITIQIYKMMFPFRNTETSWKFFVLFLKFDGLSSNGLSNRWFFFNTLFLFLNVVPAFVLLFFERQSCHSLTTLLLFPEQVYLKVYFLNKNQSMDDWIKVLITLLIPD